MNQKMTMTFILMSMTFFLYSCGGSQAIDQKSDNSELHDLTGEKFVLAITDADSSGNVEFILCTYYFVDGGRKVQTNNDSCNRVFVKNGGGLKVPVSNLEKWADYFANNSFSSFPNDRRKENWHILADDNSLKKLLGAKFYESKYPISVIVHELAWFLIDTNYDFDYICPYLYTVSDYSKYLEKCMTAQYIREYHAVEKTRKNW